jgi:protein disulfide-isomerase
MFHWPDGIDSLTGRKERKMKKLFICLAVLGLAAAGFAAEGWLTDFEAAKKQAAEKNLPILADFSGSDWCGWCIKLDNEVFSKDVFKAYAQDNLVLFLADFPSRKPQPEDVKKQNEILQKEYGIRGFPTVLLLDAEGKVLERTGYQAGGPEKYVEHIKKLLK